MGDAKAWGAARAACAALMMAWQAGASAQLREVPPDAVGQCPRGAVRKVVQGLARCVPGLVGSALPGSAGTPRGVAIAPAAPLPRAQGFVAPTPRDFTVPIRSGESAAEAMERARAAALAANAAARAAEPSTGR